MLLHLTQRLPHHLSKLPYWTLLLLCTTPLIFYRPVFQYYVAPKTFFLLALAQIVVLFIVWTGNTHAIPKLAKQPITIVLSIFVCIQLLAAVLGVDVWNSFWSAPGRMTGVFLLIHLYLLFWAIRITFDKQTAWQSFFTGWTVVGVMVTGLYWYPIFPQLALESNHGSTLGNSSLFGTYLLFLIGFSLILAIHHKTKKQLRLFALAASIFFTLTLFATDAHAAQISVLGAVALFGSLVAITMGKRLSIRRLGWVLFVALFGIVSWAAISMFVSNSVVQKWFTETGAPTRYVLWDMGRQAIQARPLLGWGPENFSDVSLTFYNPCLESQLCGPGRWSDRAHNIFLETTVGSGIIGLFSYLAIFLTIAVVLLRQKSRNKNHQLTSLLVLALMAAYLVQNQTGFDSNISLLAWIVLLAYVQWLVTPNMAYVDAKSINPLSQKKSWILPCAMTLALPFSLWFLVRNPLIGFSALSSSVQAQTYEERLQAYDKAIHVSPAGLAYRRSYMANETASNLWYATIPSLGDAQTTALQEIRSAKQALNETLENKPIYLRASLMLARIYQVEGRLFRQQALEDASHMLERTIAIHPRNPLPLWAMASVLIEQNELEKAFARTQEAFELNPDDPNAHVTRLVAAKFLGDDQLLEELFKESSQQFPELTQTLASIVQMNLDSQAAEALDLFY
jgi:O-antigen ligase